MTTRIKFGKALTILSFVFVVLETHYYGNNLVPMRKPEMACDLIGTITFIIGMILLHNKKI